MKEANVKWVAIVTIVLITVFTVIMFILSPKPEKEKGSIRTFVVEDHYDQLLYVETGAVHEGNTVIVTEQNPESGYTGELFPGKYVYLADLEYQYDVEKMEMISVEKAVYTICDLKTGEEIKSIDVKAVAEGLAPDKILFFAGSKGPVMTEDGNIYLKFLLKDKAEPHNTDLTCLIYIDTKTGESLVRSRSNRLRSVQTIYESIPRENEDLSYNLLFKDRIGLIQANGFTPYDSERYGEVPGIFVNWWEGDIAEIETLKKYLPEENKILYEEFPGLKNYEGDDDELVIFYIAGNPSAKEILEMLIEDGKEISFEGCTVPEKYSIDGKEHAVHSFEDIEKWYDE